jgi:GNAT superfamily N-acetyltransferase
VRLSVEPGPRGNWRVMLEGADAPLSEHDTEDEARERLAAYERGIAAAAAPTVETGISRGQRVTLRDGREIILRVVTAEDKAFLAAGFQDLGLVSRHQRFLSTKKQLSMAELAYFTEVDHASHEALGALDAATGAGVGIARFVRSATEPDMAEAAIAIADEWQGDGVGGALLDALADRAREVGVRRFTASLLASNRAMLTLFQHLGETTIAREGGDVINVVVDLTTPRS